MYSKGPDSLAASYRLTSDCSLVIKSLIYLLTFPDFVFSGSLYTF